MIDPNIALVHVGSLVKLGRIPMVDDMELVELGEHPSRRPTEFLNPIHILVVEVITHEGSRLVYLGLNEEQRQKLLRVLDVKGPR